MVSRAIRAFFLLCIGSSLTQCGGSTASLASRDASASESGPEDAGPDADANLDARSGDATDGAGSCDAGLSLCGGTCIDLSTSASNCGACGNACQTKGEHCSGGKCMCPQGELSCSGACVDPQTDVANCGVCGNVCTAMGQTCSGGTCLCGVQTPLLCGSACVNQLSDSKNCGSCGHDCLGGGCVSGACQPTLLSTAGGTVANGARPQNMVLDSTTVYWTDFLGGTVMSVPKVGGVASTLASGVPYPIDIAVDATTVYFTDANGLESAALIGARVVTNLSGSQTQGVALSASTVLFSEHALGAIAALPKGTDAGAISTLVTGESGPTFVALDSQNIYWTDQNGTVGSVRQALLDGGNPQQLAPGDPATSPLVVDTSAVYWAEPTNGLILSVPIGGGAVTTIAQQQTAPEGIAVDAHFVYWTEATQNGAVVKAAKTGAGGPQTLASGQGYPVPIAVDATYVYWGNDDGSILKLPK